MIRQIAIGSAISLASFSLCLLALEAVLRLPLFATEHHKPTRVETVATTSMRVPDLRWPDLQIDPKGDAFRIVVVGDSFAWGFGVHSEDAFPYRLHNLLDMYSGGDHFEVINWSHPGWGTIHQFRSLVSELDQLQPDLLILSFVLNDPEPAKHARRSKLWPILEPQMPETGLGALLYRHSRVYYLVWSRLENTRIHRDLNAYYHDLFDGDTWKDCRWALRQIRTEAFDRDIPMALVVFPLFQGQIDDSYPYVDLHTKVRDTGESLGVPVLDLLETYWGVDGRRLAVIPFTDAHPSELAHRIASDTILEFLIEKDLLPPLDGPVPPPAL
jgi:hypothetical protein